ncbi:MAG: hypothetical protein K0R59_2950 [Sphingobacterium sp.]|jgi:hypothetical protein|nr:hypothetical protein [Sphingobacterium sp.]
MIKKVIQYSSQNHFHGNGIRCEMMNLTGNSPGLIKNSDKREA